MKLRDARDTIDMLYGPPLAVLSDCLRGFLIAGPGNELVACDWSNIEGRMAAWLADERWKIKAYRDFDAGVGPDTYKLAAAGIYNKPIEKIEDHERQIGKVSELSLQFQGGVGAFQSMAKNYGVKVPDPKAEEIKQGWRRTHPNIVQYWFEIERAAVSAVRNPGRVSTVGVAGREIRYRTSGSFLFCQLPSKRVLCYPYPKLWKQVWVTVKRGAKTERRTAHGLTALDAESAAKKYAADNLLILEDISQPSDLVTYMGEDAATRKWIRLKAYGGLFFENVVQGASRCILSDALKRVEAEGLEVVMHTHDEVTIEAPVGTVPVVRLKQLMDVVPAWAKDLPIAAAGWAGKRYRK